MDKELTKKSEIQKMALYLSPTTEEDYQISWERAIAYATKLVDAGYRKLDEEKVAKGLAEIMGNVKWANIRDGSRNYWRSKARQIMEMFDK